MFRPLFALILGFSLVIAPGAFADQIIFTSETLQLDDYGDPVDTKVIRIDPDDINEAEWGVNLDDIEDALTIKKGNETLYITEDGELFLRKNILDMRQPKPAEGTETTGTETAATEPPAEAGAPATGPKDPTVPVPGAATQRIVLIPEPPAVATGEKATLKVSVAGIQGEGPLSVALSLGFDPAVLAFESFSAPEGFKVADEQVREINAERSVLRVRFNAEKLPAEPVPARTVGEIIFKAAAKGEAILEPLSVGSNPETDRTFITLGEKTHKPDVRPARVRVR